MNFHSYQVQLIKFYYYVILIPLTFADVIGLITGLWETVSSPLYISIFCLNVKLCPRLFVLGRGLSISS
jgi:hypothetical protein